jgi:hypothetical protein
MQEKRPGDRLMGHLKGGLGDKAALQPPYNLLRGPPRFEVADHQPTQSGVLRQLAGLWTCRPSPRGVVGGDGSIGRRPATADNLPSSFIFHF